MFLQLCSSIDLKSLVFSDRFTKCYDLSCSFTGITLAMYHLNLNLEYQMAKGHLHMLLVIQMALELYKYLQDSITIEFFVGAPLCEREMHLVLPKHPVYRVLLMASNLFIVLQILVHSLKALDPLKQLSYMAMTLHQFTNLVPDISLIVPGHLVTGLELLKATSLTVGLLVPTGPMALEYHMDQSYSILPRRLVQLHILELSSHLVYLAVRRHLVTNQSLLHLH